MTPLLFFREGADRPTLANLAFGSVDELPEDFSADIIVFVAHYLCLCFSSEVRGQFSEQAWLQAFDLLGLRFYSEGGGVGELACRAKTSLAICCHLDVSKLKAEYPQLKTAEDAVREAFGEVKKRVDAGEAVIPKRK